MLTYSDDIKIKWRGESRHKEQRNKEEEEQQKSKRWRNQSSWQPRGEEDEEEEKNYVSSGRGDCHFKPSHW